MNVSGKGCHGVYIGDTDIMLSGSFIIEKGRYPSYLWLIEFVWLMVIAK